MTASTDAAWIALSSSTGVRCSDVTALTDEAVLVIIAGPYLLAGVVAGYVFGLRRRIKKLERKADMEDIQWRER